MLRAERRTAHGTRSCGRRAVSGTAAARGCPEAQQQMKAKKIVIGVLLAVIGLPVLLVVVVVVSVAVLDRTNGSIVTSGKPRSRSEEHTSELQSHSDLVCRLLL